MDKTLAVAEPTLLDSLNVSMNSADVAISEVASAIPTFKGPIMERVELIKKITISEETVGSVKDGLKDIKKISDGIDGFRKRSKNEIMSHYQPIEDACKLLKSEIDEAIAPIKDNIAEYETDMREEKDLLLLQWIKEVIDSQNLDAKYIDKIEIEKKWYNASKKAVVRGIEAQLTAILHEEKVETMQMGTYQDIIAVENSKMIHDMSIEDFDIEGKSQREIIEEISTRAAEYREVEAEAIASVKNSDTRETSRHGFLIRVFAEDSRVEEVLKILEINNIYARAE